MDKNEYHSPLYQEFRHRMIDAIKLTAHPVGLYYAEADNNYDKQD